MSTYVLPDSRVIETKIYNFFVDGKPVLHPDLARIFDGIDGVELSGGSAPREFWRAILGDEAPSAGWSAPVAAETETEYQIRLERARKAHDGAVIVSVEDFDAALAGTELPVEEKTPFDEAGWKKQNPPRSAEAGGWWFSPPRAQSEALRAVLALDLGGVRRRGRPIYPRSMPGRSARLDPRRDRIARRGTGRKSIFSGDADLLAQNRARSDRSDPAPDGGAGEGPHSERKT